MPEHSLDSAKKEFASSGFKIKTGNRYLGGFIGSLKARDKWIQAEVDEWIRAVQELSNITKKIPQSAFMAIQKMLQQRWQIVQRVVKGIGGNFEKVADTIKKDFLPVLFDDTFEENDWRISLAKVKHTRLALPNPIESADMNYDVSSRCNALVRGDQRRGIFQVT